MAKKQSKLLLFVAYPIIGILFIIVSSVFALSAMGYRFDFVNGKIRSQRTGAIILSSRPGDAEVFVNEKKFSSNTSPFSFLTVQISNLDPGDFGIRLVKEGYETWDGIFKVYPGMISWGTHILLLPQKRTYANYNLPAEVESVISSTDHTKELIVTDDKINNSIAVWQINTANKTKQSLFEKRLTDGESYKPLFYSQDNQSILFERTLAGQKSYIVFQAVANGNSWDITSTFKTSFDSYIFNPRNTAELYAFKSGDLFKLNPVTKTMSGVLFSNVRGIYDHGSGLMFIQQNDKVTSLFSLESNDKSTVLIRGITDSPDYIAVYMTDEFGYAILPSTTKTLMVYPANGNVDVSPKKIADTVDYVLPSTKYQYLGYSSKGNFYCYEIEKNRYFTTLAGRQISSISWFNDQFNLAYVENGKLKMVTYNGFYDKLITDASADFPVITAADTPRLFYISTNQNKKILDLFSFDFNT